MRFRKVTTDKVRSLWHASQVELNISSQEGIKHVEHPTWRKEIQQLNCYYDKKKYAYIVHNAAEVESVLKWQ